jgi:tetratricopeptide (TPR) repeat protein
MKRRILNAVAIFVLLLFSGLNGYSQTLKDAIHLMHSEQFDVSKKAFLTLIAQEPKNGDNYFYLGECYLYSYSIDSLSFSLNDVSDSAYYFYKKGTEMEPYNPLNYTGLGKINLLKKDTTKAKAFFDRAIALLPSKTNRSSDVPIEKQALTYAKIAEAYIYVTPPQMKKAFFYVQLAQTFTIHDPSIYIIFGDIYMEDNDATNAILNYKKAQELAPMSPLAKIKIGNVYVRGRSLKAAIPYFEEAQSIDPNFAPAYRELGELYIKSGLYQKAKENYSKFLELSNKNIAARIKYIYALFLCNEFENTLVQIKDVISTDSSSVILYRLAGYSYYETLKYEEAKKYLNIFFSKINPQRIISSDYAYYARTLSKLGNDSLAINNFYKAISKDTSNYDLHSETAGLLSKVGRNDEAIKLYEKKINAGKASSLDYYYLSKIYFFMFQSLVANPLYPKTDSLISKGNGFLIKADTLCGSFLSEQPASMQGLQRRAQIKAALDPDFKLGSAKPFYEKVLIKAQTDSVKYVKELLESYDYMGWYNYTTEQNFTLAKMYYKRILAIDPKNAKAKNALNLPKLKGL